MIIDSTSILAGMAEESDHWLPLNRSLISEINISAEGWLMYIIFSD